MVAGKLWRKQDIEKKEKGITKQLMMVPENINPDIISNLVRNTKPAADIVERLAQKVELDNNNQT